MTQSEICISKPAYQIRGPMKWTSPSANSGGKFPSNNHSRVIGTQLLQNSI